MKKMVVLSAMLAVLLLAVAAHAVQFNYLDPGFVQEIYTGPLVYGQEAGMAWTSGGNLLTRDGSNIIEHSFTQNLPQHQGTSIHNVTVTHTISGLSSSGYGLTKGLDGYFYTPTSAGLQRFSTNLTSPAQTVAFVSSIGYGITTLPDGRIAYCAGSGPSDIYIFNPGDSSNTWIYTAPSLVDDIEASATGEIALAGQVDQTVRIISNTGSLIASAFNPLHHPDGLAFGGSASPTTLYSNNNDGSITQYVLGPGFSGTPVLTDIATQLLGSRAYGDLAAVGPDCAFYVTQVDNGNTNGSNAGVGTHWDNGITNNEGSIIRIAAIDKATGMEICGFGWATENVPEPGSLLVLGTGLFGLCGLLRRRK